MTDDLATYLKGRMPAYADQITPTLTVMRAFSDKRPVGVKLYDVKPVIEAAEQRDGSAR